MKSFLAVLVTVVALLPSTLLAQDLLYTFAGTLPTGASMHSMVDDGENFEVLFGIDSSAPDTTSSDSVGSYNAAVFGTLIFSGGFEANLDVNDMILRVLPDGAIVNIGSLLQEFSFQVVNESTDVLLTDALPGAGTFLNTLGGSLNSFIFYEDDLGSVSFATAESPGITFEVTAVPEPTTFGLVAIGSMATLLRRRYR